MPSEHPRSLILLERGQYGGTRNIIAFAWFIHRPRSLLFDTIQRAIVPGRVSFPNSVRQGYRRICHSQHGTEVRLSKSIKGVPLADSQSLRSISKQNTRRRSNARSQTEMGIRLTKSIKGVPLADSRSTANLQPKYEQLQ